MTTISEQRLIGEAFCELEVEEQDRVVELATEIMGSVPLDIHDAIEILYKLCRYINDNPRGVGR